MGGGGCVMGDGMGSSLNFAYDTAYCDLAGARDGMKRGLVYTTYISMVIASYCMDRISHIYRVVEVW